jgi:MOB kinase activator 1
VVVILVDFMTSDLTFSLSLFPAVDFFNQINMLYGTITEFCTEESCPIMSAGPKYEYHWADGQTVKKPIKCSAPKYIDYLMTWVQDQLDDENLFPSKIGESLGC